jgi:arylsulfatase A-like enzyme
MISGLRLCRPRPAPHKPGIRPCPLPGTAARGSVTERSSFFARSSPNNLICLWASFADPHFPYDCPEPWSRLHTPAEIDLPAHRSKDFEQRPWWHQASQENEPKLDDAALKRAASQGMRIADQSDAQLADMIANYFGMLSLIDHNVGRMLEALQQQGLLDNTLIIYSSDSSDLLGDHGLHLKVPVAYEGMLRMPMILSGPGVPANLVLDDPVSTMDIAATIYDQGAVDAPSTMQAQSLLPLLQAGAARRTVAYSEWDLSAARCGVALQLRTVRTRTHKLMMELGSGAGEMYDLENDQSEMENLFDRAEHRVTQERLQALLAARPGSISDIIPEPVGLA